MNNQELEQENSDLRQQVCKLEWRLSRMYELRRRSTTAARSDIAELEDLELLQCELRTLLVDNSCMTANEQPDAQRLIAILGEKFHELQLLKGLRASFARALDVENAEELDVTDLPDPEVQEYYPELHAYVYRDLLKRGLVVGSTPDLDQTLSALPLARLAQR